MNMQCVTVDEAGVSTAFHVYDFGDEKAVPSVTFTAGVHGNEVTGVYVARKMIKYLEKEPLLCGRVQVIPDVNAAAIRCLERRSPFDREDLNRIFPGNQTGSISHRLANAVYEKTNDADILIDLHCCSAHSEPYILSVYSEQARIKELIGKITLPIALHSEGTAGQLFTESSRNRKQAACIIELPSGHGDGVINKKAAEECFNALCDLLKALHMASGTVQGKAPTFYGKILDLSVPCAGLWQPCVQNRQTVRQGETVGTLDGAPVFAPQDGMMLKVLPEAYVMPDALDVIAYVQNEK